MIRTWILTSLLLLLLCPVGFGANDNTETKRREMVRKELAQGSSAIIRTDFRSKEYTQTDRDFAKRIIGQIAPLISELYQIQKGALKYRADIFQRGTQDDIQLYQRNQGPWCQATLTQDSPFCNAHPNFPKPKSDAYPPDIKQDAAMCEMFHAQPNGDALMDPFVVVRREKKGFVPVPLNQVYAARMKSVAQHLRKAAKIYPENEERALRAYLLAAAQAFEDNDWEKADEAWSAMNETNSRWYLRVGPDETYFDPCQEKAGFALTFAKVSSGSAKLKKVLFDHRQKLETQMASLIGTHYKPRTIGMKTPEFVEMIYNAGDSRHALGAVVGQTLPNWGEIAQKGRRNWNATNFYTDPTSVENRKKRAKLFFVPRLLKILEDSQEASLRATVIHEVTHNIGPDSSFEVNDQTAKERFGRLSSVLEELKAQTGASWYLPYLKEQGVFSEKDILGLYLSNIFWCFNQISYSGLFSSSGTPRAYGQLAAIQVAMLMEDGALKKVNTPEGWRFDVVEAKLPKSFERIMKRVGQIKVTPGTAQQALKAAKDFIGYYVGLAPGKPGKGCDQKLIDEIAERYRSIPKESFEYETRF